MDEEQFNEWIDDSSEIITIKAFENLPSVGVLKFSPSQVLKALDPVAYRIAFFDLGGE